MVELKDITMENLDAVLALEVYAGQEPFVSNTAHSLGQAWIFRKTAFPFAVCDGQTVVGFLMLGYYEEKDQYTVWKLLIDKHQQRKGYGRAALQLGIQFLRERFAVREIYLGVIRRNWAAIQLYSSFGFVETGDTAQTALEMKLTLEEEPHTR